jgi:hypothetical protein
MEIYGDYTAAALKRLEPQSAGMVVQRQKLEERVAAVRAARGGKRDVGVGGHSKRGERDSLRDRVAKALSSLKSHLAAVNKDEDDPDVDLSLFFEGGRLGELSNSSPAQVLIKADFALKGFEAAVDFPLKAEKRERLGKLAQQLRASLGESSAARPEEAGVSTELQRAGEEWRIFYRGLKWIVWGFLIQERREGEYASFFKDEAVSGQRGGFAASPTPPAAGG